MPAPATAHPSPAATERAALVDLFARTGPDAPTLCEGWTTYDLATHLVLRERRPLALAGVLLPPLAPVTRRLQQRERQRPYADLVADLRAGPPLLSPARFGDVAELHEWYVHHEDVRRLVEPGPRPAGTALQDALWSRLRGMGPLLAARARGLGIVLQRTDGQRRRVRRGSAQVVLHGEPSELFLWLFGRRDVAHVELEGDPDAVARAKAVRLGV